VTKLKENPFNPTFGSRSYFYIPRTKEKMEFVDAVFKRGNPQFRKVIYKGIRGSGKTLLISEVLDAVRKEGANTVRTTFGASNLLDRIESQTFALVKDEVTLKKLSIKIGQIAIGTDSKFDSPTSTFESRMRELVSALSNKDKPLVFAIDEVSENSKELYRFTKAFQEWEGDGFNVALILAGLPENIVAMKKSKSNDGQTASFLRRMEEFPLGQVATATELARAYAELFETSGKEFPGELAFKAAQRTLGYPFAIQAMGSYIWQQTRRLVSEKIVDESIEFTKQEMFTKVNAMIYDDLSNRTKDFVNRMAEYDPNKGNPAVPMSFVREVEVFGDEHKGSANTFKQRLISAMLIAPASDNGRSVRFALPFFRDYIWSLMTDNENYGESSFGVTADYDF
jgi:hypothetical protein